MKRMMAVIAVMIFAASSFVVLSDSDSYATSEATFYVGQYLSGTDDASMIVDVEYGTECEGNIPGIKINGIDVRHGGRPCIILSGTFTTAGNYVLKVLENGTVVQNVTVHVIVRSESVTVSAPQYANAGSQFTVTADVQPSNATNRNVEWTVTGATVVSSEMKNGKSYCTFVSSAVGKCSITAAPADGYGSGKTVNVEIRNPSHTEKLVFDANEGSNAPATITNTSTGDSGTKFTIPSDVPSRSLYSFLGWSENKKSTAAQYLPGSTLTVNTSSTVTLYAVWSKNVIQITSCDAPSAVASGSNVSFSVDTSADGCTVSVTGADWLTVQGHTVSGKAGSVGSYTVKITVSKDNYPPAVLTKSVTVVSALKFVSEPSLGTSSWR
mgnify:CR=1 FL=1